MSDSSELNIYTLRPKQPESQPQQDAPPNGLTEDERQLWTDAEPGPFTMGGARLRMYLEDTAQLRAALTQAREALTKIAILAESSELCGDKIPAVTARTLLPICRAALAATRPKP